MYNAHLHVWPTKRRCYCVFAIFKREIGNVSIGCQILYTIVIIRVVSPSDSREARCSLSPLKFGPNCGVFDYDFRSCFQGCFFFFSQFTFFNFYLNFNFLYSIWTFISLFYFDCYFPFLSGLLFSFSIWTFYFIFLNFTSFPIWTFVSFF